MRAKHGFTLIELLIVVAIIAILAAILIPNLVHARVVAQERAAEAHAKNIYTAAFAHLSENPSHVLVVSADCIPGYIAGNYAVSRASSSITACSVSDNGNGLPLVMVTNILGTNIQYPQ
jgi:type IV pilus assembly protein PilA